MLTLLLNMKYKFNSATVFTRILLHQFNSIEPAQIRFISQLHVGMCRQKLSLFYVILIVIILNPGIWVVQGILLKLLSLAHNSGDKLRCFSTYELVEIVTVEIRYDEVRTN